MAERLSGLCVCVCVLKIPKVKMLELSEVIWWETGALYVKCGSAARVLKRVLM